MKEKRSRSTESVAGTAELDGTRRRVLQVIAGGAVVVGAEPRSLFAWARALHESGELGETSPLSRLTEGEAEAVAVLVDRILPASDTPGARAAGVHLFIDRMLAGWLDERAARRFLKGLRGTLRRARRQFGVPLAALLPEQVDELLTAAALSARSERPGESFSTSRATLHRQPFFDVLKWLTLVGYYTSEVGMREELGYKTLPGTYDPCVDVAALGRGE